MEAFIKENVLSDMKISQPSGILKLKYGSINVNPGMVMTPTQVQNQPDFSFDAEPNAFYTIIMNDPDAPSRADPKFGEWHHWAVANIPGSDLTKGDVLTEYVGSGPPQGTGLHRYVFLVFKQVSRMSFNEPRLTNRSMDHRAQQKVAIFTDKYKFDEPVAGNFYQAEWDDYVPKLYEQLSGGGSKT